MALSPKARIAAIGGALAIGVLGAGGVAYAAGGSGSGTASYVTVVDDQGATTAPADGQRSEKDCPQGTAPGGGSGTGSGSGSGTGSATPGDA